MADVYSALFIIGISAVIVLIGIKVYNLMTLGRLYDWKVGVLIFLGYLLAWFFLLLVFLINLETTLYRVGFLLASLLMPLNVLFLFAEIFIILANIVNKPKKAYNAIEARGIK